MRSKDHINHCMSSVNFKLPQVDFENAFCQMCTSSDCGRAGKTVSKFESRVSTQKDKLFNATRALPDDPTYDRVRESQFHNLVREAVRLEQGAMTVAGWGTATKEKPDAIVVEEPKAVITPDPVEATNIWLPQDGYIDDSKPQQLQSKNKEVSDSWNSNATTFQFKKKDK
jgi:hypothetical protein